MTKTSNIADFLSKGATVFFSKGTDNSGISGSRIGKLAMALSLAGSVGLMTPSAAEARGGGMAAGVALGLIGGMVLSRTVVAAPTYQQYAPVQQYVPVQQYAPVQQYVPPVDPYGGYGGGRPGVYYCPNGPQNRCYWRNGALETIDDGLNKAAELETSAPKMG